MAKELLGAAGAGKIADSDGNHYDPVGSTQGERGSFLKEVGDNVKEKIGSMIGTNALDPAAVVELEQKNPGALAFLSSASGAVMEMMIFAIYIGLDMGKSLLSAATLRGDFSDTHTIIASSLIITSGAIQFCVAMTTLVVLEGAAGLRKFADPKRFSKFVLVSLLFALAQNFGTLAYLELPAGTIKILGQCRLLNTAILSKIVFNRRYTETQWMLMMIIIIAAVLHIMAKATNKDLYNTGQDVSALQTNISACQSTLTSLSSTTIINREVASLQPVPEVCVFNSDSHHSDEGTNFLGLFYVFAYIMCSDIASIVSEMFLKSEMDTPFYIQKATIEGMGVPILIIMSFIGPWFQMVFGVDPWRWAPQMWWAGPGTLGGMFGGKQGWEWCNEPYDHHGMQDPWVISHGGCGASAGGFYRDWNNFLPWGALFFYAAQSWFAGILVKLLSSVMKLLAKIVSLGGVYFIGDVWLLRPKEGVSTGATMAAIQVMMLTYTYLQIKPEKPKETKIAEEPGAVELPERGRPV